VAGFAGLIGFAGVAPMRGAGGADAGGLPGWLGAGRVATCGLGVVTSASVFVACAAALSPFVGQIAGQVRGALARLALRPARRAIRHPSGPDPGAVAQEGARPEAAGAVAPRQ
jgi:hypothetical protein